MDSAHEFPMPIRIAKVQIASMLADAGWHNGRGAVRWLDRVAETSRVSRVTHGVNARERYRWVRIEVTGNDGRRSVERLVRETFDAPESTRS